jgi:hypothetical protein
MRAIFYRSRFLSLASVFVLAFLLLSLLSCSEQSGKGMPKAVEVGNPADIAPSGTTGGKVSEPGGIKGLKSIELALTPADFGEVSALSLNVESARLVSLAADASEVRYSSPLESVERSGFLLLQASERQLITVAVDQDGNFPTSRLHIDLIVKVDNPGSVKVEGRQIDLARIDKAEERLIRIELGDPENGPDLNGTIVLERFITRDQVLEPRESQQQTPPPVSNLPPPVSNLPPADGAQPQPSGPAYVLKTRRLPSSVP